MERKIGEVFGYNGEWYQCVKDSSNNCVNCCFYNGGHKECSDELGECSKGCRSDETSVIFKKLRKVGEPFSDEYFGLVQKYELKIYGYSTKDKMVCFADGYDVFIKTKQNKEYMGDNADIRPYDELFSPGTVSNTKHLVKEDMEEKKLNLKPFDIQKVKEGKPICTRDGRKARIICFDSNGGRPIVALVTECDDEEEIPYKYHCDGFYNCQSIPSDNDLMMLPEKKEGWVNVYSDMIHTTLEDADNARKNANNSNYIQTLEVEWKE